ncbi:SNF2-related protein [Ornithinimicrobium kibberense]|uniref:SNF2-related protein n=1 Tax=Ornithinimicrobium kibberense TaxID=282060 RepID=UPI001142D1E2|nr:SNF2-related protein [Ornithinimicrobium kibberense]
MTVSVKASRTRDGAEAVAQRHLGNEPASREAQGEAQTLSPHQAKYLAYELQRSYASDHVGKLAGLLFDAQVEPKPHQIDAALFALQTPFLKGVILADEVGLGKTIEAGIVITQYWAERRRNILIVAPSSLRQQWQQELYEKFLIPSSLLDAKNKERLLGAGHSPEVLICSYEFAQRHEPSLIKAWDLVVADEAHRLRNYWNGKAKVANAVAHIVEDARKTVLLTATPLQNKLEELYGLVSVFDSEYFYSLDAFRERYVKNREPAAFDDLGDRVAQITKRTLRRDADKYIRFTERLPLTVGFEPSPDEQRLYELVNDYLQRDEVYAFSKSTRHLSALIIRKRLGSSTYAIASTLEKIADRLEREIAEGKQWTNSGAFIVDADLTDEEEEVDEAPRAGFTAIDPRDIEPMRDEVRELREYAALARSITVNEKAVQLNHAVDLGFERLCELGAPEKAIIFTDSTVTQEYIARSLTEAGRGDGLLLFNGNNDSPQATKIYQKWLERNKGSDVITGVLAADRRKALVDYFRDEGTIMIATEAASEGINLQFCSMVVNYDLPWNPQRVEQRIGRAHRFGQQHNVVVVNFSNKGNLAEQRILELLEDKFHLFKGVFGASDEVLGSIEDGLDFEKTISDILNRCKTADDIEFAFNELEKQFEGEISMEMASAKAKVFDNLDPNVQDRLKSYDTQSGEVLNKFERLLLAVTKHQLVGHATFEGDGRLFELHTAPIPEATPGRYFFKSQPQEHAHQYRYSSPLAEYVVQSSQSADTPPRELTFSLGQSERVPTAMKALEGKSGRLVSKVVTFRIKAGTEDISESYALSGMLTDDGKWLDHEYVADLMDLACTTVSDPIETIDESVFATYLDVQRETFEKEVQSRNARYYDQQEELLYRNTLDRKAESEGLIREYRQKEKESRKAARQTDDPMEQLRHKKEARRWAQKAEDEDDRARVERIKLREEIDKYLDLIEQSLRGKRETEDLFCIRWKVTA